MTRRLAIVSASTCVIRGRRRRATVIEVALKYDM
jgi:hypothetical protein